LTILMGWRNRSKNWGISGYLIKSKFSGIISKLGLKSEKMVAN